MTVYFDDPWYVSPLPIEEIEAAGCNPTMASSAQTCFLASQDQILSRGSMSCIAMGLTAVASSIRVFGNERVVYLREASSLPQPYHSIAYFLAKDLSYLPNALIAPFLCE